MTKEEEIVSASFKLCDLSGNVRAVLGTGSNGMPYFNFYSDVGNPPRLSLSLDHDGTPHITLFNGNKVGVAVGISESGAGISVHDHDGTPRVRIGLSDDAEAFVELLNSEGETVWVSS